MIKIASCILTLLISFSMVMAQDTATKPAPAKWSPGKNGLSGPVPVAAVLIEFQDTAYKKTPYEFQKEIDLLGDLSQESYFKLYSNDIVWPVITIYPNLEEVYKDENIMGYYCYYDFWSNPMGWKSKEEGGKRVAALKERALKFAKSKNSRMNYKSIAFCYCVDRIEDPAKRPNINGYFTHIARPANSNTEDEADDDKDDNAKKTPKKAPKKTPKKSGKDDDDGRVTEHPEALIRDDEPFDAWAYYSPQVRWAEPLWPNSSMQQWGASAYTFAHEFGHVIGAPDVYRIGRSNDGIGGVSTLLSYGPTSTAYSRYYHHGYIEAKNYPMITTSGNYTLHPRHINPKGNEAVGFIIPSKHPHYFYHVEYICGENPALGASGSVEGMNDHSKGHVYPSEATNGMVISVIRPGLGSYQGSPDMFYTYREEDPYFRGGGKTDKCLFGEKYNKTEFNMNTEPSSRLPNLLDGGIKISKIKEGDGTLTFNIDIDKTPLKAEEYRLSLIPQIKLDGIDEVLATNFRMKSQHKFRGEPLFQSYGFCWSTNPKPTVKNDFFTLRHGELFNGRATNLKPNTKYYVRAWISNAMGIRYSDEELEVTTLAKDVVPEEVSPLLIDQYARNWFLYRSFYGHGPGGKTEDPKQRRRLTGYTLKQLAKTSIFTSYPALAAAGQLIAYYQPEKFMVTIGGGDDKRGRDIAMDYSQLHWEPQFEDPGYRTSATHAFFKSVLKISRELQMHLVELNDAWMKTFPMNAKRILKLKEEPVITELKDSSMDEAFKRIKEELIQSRPVLILQNPSPDSYEMPQWALIDGYNKEGKLHIDYPSDCGKKVGYYNKEDIKADNHRTYIITGLNF